MKVMLKNFKKTKFASFLRSTFQFNFLDTFNGKAYQANVEFPQLEKEIFQYTEEKQYQKALSSYITMKSIYSSNSDFHRVKNEFKNKIFQSIFSNAYAFKKLNYFYQQEKSRLRNSILLNISFLVFICYLYFGSDFPSKKYFFNF